MKSKFLFIFLAILFVSCSRLPKERVPQAKINADQTLILAQNNENKLINAKILYENAFHQYRMLADTEGQLQALSGLARISFQEKDSLSFQNWQHKMDDIIHTIDDSKQYHLQLLDLYVLHAKRNWQEISSAVNLDKNDPKTAKIQLLSYKIQADTYLKRVDKKELKQLEKLQKYYAKRIGSRHYSHPQLTANASYTLAFYYFIDENYRQANSYIQKAKDIDYLFEFQQNFAYDLWLEAQILLAENKIAQGTSLLYQAKAIFMEWNNEEMIQKIEKIMETE